MNHIVNGDATNTFSKLFNSKNKTDIVEVLDATKCEGDIVTRNGRKSK